MRRIGRISWNDQELHLRPFLAPDHFDNLVQPHVAHVDNIAGGLADGSDPVSDLQPAVNLSGSPGNKALNFCVAVLSAQHRPDAHKRQAHINAEILQIGLAQIFGVRVVRLRHRVEKILRLLVPILLMNVAREPIVATRDELRPRLDRMLTQMFLQKLTRDAAAPKIVGLRFVLWPRRFLPGQVNGTISLEIGWLL